MRKETLFLVSAVILALSLPNQTNAAAPQLVNYQGLLTDSTGGGLDTTVNIVFTIYDAPSAGSVIWKEVQSSVIVTAGLFNVLLGSVTSLVDTVFNDTTRYLGVQVGIDPELFPRTRLVSVTYSFRSVQADEANLAAQALHADTADYSAFADSARVADELDSLSSEDFSRTGHSHAGGASGWTDDGTVVRLDAAGDSLGIGTTTPTEKLEVSGNIKATGTIQSGSSIIIDGVNDVITASSGTIGFDNENLVTTGNATIGPGHSNTGLNAFIAGENNGASGIAATIGGGINNVANGDYSKVGGGTDNFASTFSATVGGGSKNTASGYESTIGGGALNITSDTAATVGGGSSNRARGVYSVVAGGGGATSADSNSAIGDYSSIGGGRSNLASVDYSTIAGGRSNSASGGAASIGGGITNFAIGNNSTIAGGQSNKTDSIFSTVGGGFFNFATHEYATIGGGLQNQTSSRMATVGGGVLNTASGVYSAVAGGSINTASDSAASVGGGSNNKARGVYSVVAGGGGTTDADSNSAIGAYSSIGGGTQNLSIGNYSTIGGGLNDSASGRESTIAGGSSNIASGNNSAIGGGFSNQATNLASVVAGGYQNRARSDYAAILGGLSNDASGAYAIVLGGRFARADSAFSLAAGWRARAMHRGSFVFADTSSNVDFNSSANNQFNIRAAGGTRIYSNGALTTGVTLSAGGGAWVAVSDSSVKRNIRAVDEFEILEKVANLPISRWSYETQSPNIEHIGPMAQDFYSAFGLGEDEKGISTLDPDGVSLAAIKALYRENKELKRRIEKLETIIFTKEK